MTHNKLIFNVFLIIGIVCAIGILGLWGDSIRSKLLYKDCVTECKENYKMCLAKCGPIIGATIRLKNIE